MSDRKFLVVVSAAVLLESMLVGGAVFAFVATNGVPMPYSITIAASATTVVNLTVTCFALLLGASR